MWKHKRPWIAKAIVGKSHARGSRVSVTKASGIGLETDTRPGDAADSGTGPHSYSSLPFDNCTKHTCRRKEPLQQMGPRKPSIHTQKNGTRSSLLPRTEINSDWIKEVSREKPLQDEVQSKIFWLELQ